MGGAVFLDRDGVLIANRYNYVRAWEEVHFLPGALRAAAGIVEMDLPIVIVTNQSAVGRGLIAPKEVEHIHAQMIAAMQGRGVPVAGVYFCPHHPDAGCACRKPEAGLLLQAANDLDLDLSKSFMIGDALTDVLAGQRAGARSILLMTGRGAMQLSGPRPAPLAPFDVARDLAEAVDLIKQTVADGA
jgi:D-glycero-D-manno-heptose 1,7-bisphosphate phosphatase